MARAKIVIALLLIMAITTVGIVAAKNDDKFDPGRDPAITVLPKAGPHVTNDGTILAPINEDAFNSVGLAAEYEHFAKGSPFNVTVINTKTGVVQFHTNGITDKEIFDVEVHWMVPSDVTASYSIIADGTDANGQRTTYIKDVVPIQPIPVSILTLLGFVLFAGLVWLRR